MCHFHRYITFKMTSRCLTRVLTTVDLAREIGHFQLTNSFHQMYKQRFAWVELYVPFNTIVITMTSNNF